MNLFVESDPYQFVVDHNPEVERIYRLQQLIAPPVDLSLIAGDAIHNFRSSLDHMACQLVAANGNSFTRRTAFTIYDVAPTEEIGNSAVVQGIHPGAIDIIKAVQPYETGCDTLWKLHKLDIADKHHVLLIVGYLNPTASVGPVPYNGAEIGRVSGSSVFDAIAATPDDVQEDFEFSVQIAFTESQVADSDPILPLLKQFANILNALASQFEQFLV